MPKQKEYFDKVIRLHYEKGYGAYRISYVLPIGKTMALKWINIFAEEKGKISETNMKEKPQKEEISQAQSAITDNMTDKIFMACVKFLEVLGKFMHMTYKQISVIFNLWVQGIVLLLASVAPLIVSIVRGYNIVVIGLLAVYASVCVIG